MDDGLGRRDEEGGQGRVAVLGGGMRGWGRRVREGISSNHLFLL